MAHDPVDLAFAAIQLVFATGFVVHGSWMFIVEPPLETTRIRWRSATAQGIFEVLFGLAIISSITGNSLAGDPAYTS